MLQSQTATPPSDEDLGQFLTPSHILGIVKRRALYFLIPFFLLAAIGSVLALAWPAIYLSKGKILVQSPEIPTDLVRPTVVSRAGERIQVLEQRILTRDNILAIAQKFHLSNSWQGLLSGTEIVDFVRERTQIEPIEQNLPGQKQQAIAYTVGFEYENPAAAMGVANELLTMILKEDARTRTSNATETTSFIERDVQRIESQLALLDSQIAQLKQRQPKDPAALTDADKLDSAKELSALRAQLLIKSATLSASHPDIIALKRRIAALQKADLSSAETKESDAADSAGANSADGSKAGDPASAKSSGLGVDSLETKRVSLRKELETATQKLAAARLGENLERGQHSERLEVIEQPTLPTKPIKPNRKKLFVLVFAAALMAGGGLAVAAEMLDSSIRRSQDLYSLVDSHLVISIPYIATRGEEKRRKRLILASIAIVAVFFVAAIIAVIFVLPPLDILFQKALTLLLEY